MQSNINESTKAGQSLDIDKLFNLYFTYPNNDTLTVLVTEFQPVIKKIASTFTSNLEYCNCDFCDLVQEGNLTFISLLRGNKYNKDLGVKPITFFYNAISKLLITYINRSSTPFELSDYQMKKIRNVKKYQKDIDNGISIKKALKKNKISKKDLNKYNNVYYKSIDDIAFINESGEEVNYSDIIPGKENVEEEVVSSLKNEHLYKKIKDVLDKLDYTILMQRYIDEYNIQDISLKNNVSVSDVYQSLSKSLKILRNNLNKDDYI